ncbi:MAG: hypothetical protein ACOYKE_08010, partial [Ferruginibacter sp.]
MKKIFYSNMHPISPKAVNLCPLKMGSKAFETFKLYAWMLLFSFIGLMSNRTLGQCSGGVLNISSTSPSTNSVTGQWVVPAGGTYKIKITASGAKGGEGVTKDDFSSETGYLVLGNGGRGASSAGVFFLSSGQVLQANAGSPGAIPPIDYINYDPNTSPGGGGGGGASGVRLSSGTLLLIAAGGGGGAYYGDGGDGNIPGGNGNGGTANSGAGGGGLNSAGSVGTGGSSNAAGGGANYNGTGGALGSTGLLFGTGFGGPGGGGFGAGGGANMGGFHHFSGILLSCCLLPKVGKPTVIPPFGLTPYDPFPYNCIIIYT